MDSSVKCGVLVFIISFIWGTNTLILNADCTKLLSATPPDKDTKCCGHDSIIGNKLYGGNETAIDQYPWLALIEYKGNDDQLKTLCGGVLISARYVLTAAHCVTGPLLKLGTPVNIRLGEHDTSHEGVDCVHVEAGGEDCNEGTTTIAIEKCIPHSDYNKKNHNDIALIRMKEQAPFTDFIRPICLPTADLTTDPPSPFQLFAAGWGAVSDTKLYSALKLHIELPYVTRDKCQEQYRAPGRKATLVTGQICAGGVAGKDSCKGDSGGPLMYEGHERVYKAVGIVSYGPSPCGMDGVPGIYTNVFEYRDWILNQIQA